MAEENDVKELVEKKNGYTPKKEKKSIFSRIWNWIWLHGDDIEQRLQYISKAEASLLARIKKRASRRRRMARDLIVFSVIFEVAAIGYAIMTTRTANMDWRVRGLRVLPMFLLPVLSRAFYSGLITFTGMCDRRDQRALEKLRAERQEKIDELKERTNYYNTQQLIQKYDPDPAAKAAAASVLASKLGADSGLQVSVGGDEPQPNQQGAGKSSDVDFAQSTGLRRRNPPEARSPGGKLVDHSDKETASYAGSEVSEISLPSELVVEHHNPMAINSHDGGWVARLAALLVGDDPSQSYALICGNCHSHNGLARKEDYPFISYYCPHCHSLNRPRKSDENSSGTNTPDTRSSTSHRHGSNKPKNSDENLSETNTRDTRSSMADANLRKQSSESTTENVSASSTPPEAVAVKES
ncbi:uncharacterized protein At2g24330-like [Cynara cardunculus var. scolymus]|uniref:uncharacterized protein At2g24330-like n=1 Tax=Cynara cardunculus var. scolymus TaxID=59895 RepID=UPI000D629049|nr:uncharacterized protein At2g24330-like [Cynara cardunculus var. scolymus]XP_024979300.1 uncharacterized protein At2g24330-like [Cynara cardunculus var. scolymus]XP_024979302.1 uncharacterized protein At2g24330-like [Cynara cardunculus var. scolymus]XP_024979303.1 uncharacterized protein At2g24330-like [Cynara cardunculus var. scolymus]